MGHEIGLQANGDPYRSAADLIHYWRPGERVVITDDHAGSVDLINRGIRDWNVVQDGPARLDPADVHNPVSIDFDGQSEYLANTQGSALGVANAWTLTAWIKPFALESRMAVVYLGSPFTSSLSDTIRLQLRGDLAGAPLDVIVGDRQSGSVHYRVYGVAALERWVALGARWDGGRLDLYIDGVRVPDSGVERLADDPIEMSDPSDRGIWVGRDSIDAAYFDGRIGHIAFFARALEDLELALLVLGGHAIDLREAHSAYAPTALAHYWRLGEDPTAPAADLGQATPIDLLRDAQGIGYADDVWYDGPESLLGE
jgi:hypothetical protein